MTLSSLMTLKLDLLCRMFTFKTSLNPLLSEKYPAAGSHLEKVFQKVSDLKKSLMLSVVQKVRRILARNQYFPNQRCLTLIPAKFQVLHIGFQILLVFNYRFHPHPFLKCCYILSKTSLHIWVSRFDSVSSKNFLIDHKRQTLVQQFSTLSQHSNYGKLLN